MPIDPTGTLSVGVLELTGDSVLTGHGELVGSLENRATVTPDVGSEPLVVLGDYWQSGAGTLIVNVDGALGSADYSTLAASGTAVLDGTLHIQRANDYVPDTVSDYVVLESRIRNGEFASVTGSDIVEDRYLRAHYSSHSVALGREFERAADAEHAYTNNEPGQLVYFDVRQIDSEHHVEFRLYDPDEELVFVSNATSDNPNLGDLGPVMLAKAGEHTLRVYAYPGEPPAYDWQIHEVPATQVRPLTINQPASDQNCRAG